MRFDKVKEHHAKLREEAAERIWQLHMDAIAADKEHQANKPERLKEIDDALDVHIFRKLFL